MKKNFLAALLLSTALALAGCNTVQGFGQDLKKGAEHVGAALGKAGDKISSKAESAQQSSEAAE